MKLSKYTRLAMVLFAFVMSVHYPVESKNTVAAQTQTTSCRTQGRIFSQWKVSLDEAFDNLRQSSAEIEEYNIADWVYNQNYSVVVFFDEPDFQDEYEVFTTEMGTRWPGREHEDFWGNMWYQDETDSILYFTPYSAVKLRLYSDPNYRGVAVGLCGPAAVPNMNGLFKDRTGLGNNGLSSFKILS